MTHAVARFSRGRWWGDGYHWWHGHQINWSRSRIIRNSDRAQASQRVTHPQRFEGFAYARDCACASRLVGCAGRTERFGQSWHRVLDGVVDWWSASSFRVARWSVDGSAVSQLSEDLRFGDLVGRRCDESLVYVAEWADCDSSCGEADRTNGRAMHSMVKFAWVHSERSCKTGLGGDKGGK